MYELIWLKCVIVLLICLLQEQMLAFIVKRGFNRKYELNSKFLIEYANSIHGKKWRWILFEIIDSFFHHCWFFPFLPTSYDNYRGSNFVSASSFGTSKITIHFSSIKKKKIWQWTCPNSLMDGMDTTTAIMRKSNLSCQIHLLSSSSVNHYSKYFSLRSTH